MPRIDITDKYIRVRIEEPSKFQKESFRVVDISKKEGIKAIMGKKKNKTTLSVQAFLFDRAKDWTKTKAKKWVEEHRKKKQKSKAELLGERKTIVTASAQLCESLPNLALGKDIKKVTKEYFEKLSSEAKLNDKYFFFVEAVHEGPNLNEDYFFKDELAESYRSAAMQLIDWEHDRQQIIGFTSDSQLISEPEKPLALGVNGILNRLSPYLQYEDEGTGKSRDEIVKQRYFENNLSISMEALFDKVRCTKCGYETDDFFEFEHHKYSIHGNDEEVFRGLIGIDFIGFGIVNAPADSETDIMYLRTSDEGTLEDIVTAEYKEKYGDLADNVAIANFLSNLEPDINLIEGKLVINAEKDKKNDQNGTKIEQKTDKDNKQDDILSNNNNTQGGKLMIFKLAEKVAKAKTLSDVFVIAQSILKDYMGDKVLSSEEKEAFKSELAEIILAKISEDNFKVNCIYTLTNEVKLDAISQAREEEKAIAEEEKKSLNSTIDKLTKEKEDLNKELEKAKTDIKELKDAEAKKELDNKVQTFIEEIVTSGVSLTDTMKTTLQSIVFAKIKDVETDKEEEVLNEIKDGFISTIKQSKLSDASNLMGGLSGGADNNQNDDIGSTLAKIREKHNKEDNK